MNHLSLHDATAMVDRGRDHATRIGVPMTIAVTDGAGYLLALSRMDGAVLGSVDIAVKKARTCAFFNGPSEGLWELCRPGGPAPTLEDTNGGMIPHAGGLPIHNGDGSLIGAVGCAGGLPVQDGEVARAAADHGASDGPE
jgi:uncharacterized protein GlcG (DUF336 family)